MTPVVTVLWKPSGFSIAMAICPTGNLSESPRLALGSPLPWNLVFAGIGIFFLLASWQGGLTMLPLFALLVPALTMGYVAIRDTPGALDIIDTKKQERTNSIPMTELLPPIEEPLLPAPGVFFSKNGLQYPLPHWEAGHWGTLAGLAVGVVAWWLWGRRARAHFEHAVSPVGSEREGIVRPSYRKVQRFFSRCAGG